ncbi:LapA family protein [Candidatus Accumulibacter sp. ACC007]|uniref:LapA family protein n=1 Tax=Candidatus Accumulibacter sp. ACC007 TaxID=2823333 RepID=UPI0025C72D33|nr:LapA family protein [Candidatus Accumulibacter sp. ACC007]
MKFRTLFLLLILAATAGFSALNWDAFITPTTLSLGVTDVQAPIGVIMLGVVSVLTAYFLLFVIYVQASALFDSRRHAQELKANQELADRAEASRFTDLRGFITTELQAMARQNASNAASGGTDPALLARLDRVETELLSAVEQSGNNIVTSLAGIEDRLTRSADGGLPAVAAQSRF